MPHKGTDPHDSQAQVLVTVQAHWHCIEVLIKKHFQLVRVWKPILQPTLARGVVVPSRPPVFCSSHLALALSSLLSSSL